MRDLDGALVLSELDRRDINIAGRQCDRLFRNSLDRYRAEALRRIPRG